MVNTEVPTLTWKGEGKGQSGFRKQATPLAAVGSPGAPSSDQQPLVSNAGFPGTPQAEKLGIVTYGAKEGKDARS